jgi:hypothetical protein
VFVTHRQRIGNGFLHLSGLGLPCSQTQCGDFGSVVQREKSVCHFINCLIIRENVERLERENEEENLYLFL